MKGKKRVGVTNPVARNGLKAKEESRGMKIQKRNPEYGVLRRLREHLLYSKLRSLLPPSSPQVPVDCYKVEGFDEVRVVHEEATEIEMEQNEIPSDIDQSSSSEEEINRTGGSGGACFISTDDDEQKEEHEEDGVNDDSFTLELEIEENRPFVPSIDIKTMEDSIFVSTVALKGVALASKLFQILEEEKLDIVFENQCRTEDTVCYNIQMRLEPGYDLDALGKKLGKWAGGTHM